MGCVHSFDVEQTASDKVRHRTKPVSTVELAIMLSDVPKRYRAAVASRILELTSN